MRNLVRVVLVAASFSLVACAATKVQPTIIDCYVWPEEGDAAYSEIQQACGGDSMPNCPAHKEWRYRLGNLKKQLDACAPKEL